jgi:hypothetical protein
MLVPTTWAAWYQPSSVDSQTSNTCTCSAVLQQLACAPPAPALTAMRGHPPAHRIRELRHNIFTSTLPTELYQVTSLTAMYALRCRP